MSVRAYIVKKIETDKELFNLWHDIALVDYLKDWGCLGELNMDMAGLAEIPIQALEEFVYSEHSKNMDKEKIDYLKEIVIDYKDRGEDYIMVYCY